MMTNMELSAPSNWCDYRCTRCPLARACPARGEEVRTAEEIQGEALIAAEAAARAQDAAYDEGFSRGWRDAGPDDDNPDAPYDEAGLAEQLAAFDAPDEADGEGLPPMPPDLPNHWLRAWDRLVPRDTRALLVIGKVGRVMGYMAHWDPEDEIHAADTIPNLLLLERLLGAMRADAERLRPTRPGDVAAFDDVDSALRAMLAPLFELISDDDRAVLDALAAAGQAPSPFARLDPP
jgi:hypothetical protein